MSEIVRWNQSKGSKRKRRAFALLEMSIDQRLQKLAPAVGVHDDKLGRRHRLLRRRDTEQGVVRGRASGRPGGDGLDERR